jgi:hypothetical protein
MYRTCPQCQHTRAEDDSGNPDVCPACGLIFSKWMQNRFRSSQQDDGHEMVAMRPSSARLIAFIGFLLWAAYYLLQQRRQLA